MSKYLLFAALLILIGYGSKLQAGDTDPLYALTGGDEDGTEMPADSNDALSVFSAKIKDKTVYINWRVVNPKVISYFEVLRLDPRKKEYRKINDDRIEVKDYFEKSVVSESGIVYMYDFEDEPERDGVYYYKLKGYSSAGNLVFEADEIKIGITGIKNFKVEQNTPNPFNPTTTIAYEAASSGPIQFTIHNLLGQSVWSSTEVLPGPGHYEFRWNGTNYTNEVLPSGIYFVRMQTHRGFHGTQKLMFLK